jgi:hypothetical protein
MGRYCIEDGCQQWQPQEDLPDDLQMTAIKTNIFSPISKGLSQKPDSRQNIYEMSITLVMISKFGNNFSNLCSRHLTGSGLLLVGTTIGGKVIS